jgi:drug/metabolite transporter (DMT)-like permease
VLLLVEPVFAALLATITGDPLTAVQVGGAALILFAVVLCEVAPEWLDRRVSAREAVPR